jgi:hypothetical protein
VVRYERSTAWKEQLREAALSTNSAFKVLQLGSDFFPRSCDLIHATIGRGVRMKILLAAVFASLMSVASFGPASACPFEKPVTASTADEVTSG